MGVLFDEVITSLPLIGELVVIEGLLSFDNALALAALVNRKLSCPEERKKALTWGIWGAYILRIVTIFLGVWLMKWEWVKVLAGLYLLGMAFHVFLIEKIIQKKPSFHLKDFKDKIQDKVPKFKFLSILSPLWQTILLVEMMDFMFSIDSIAVTLAISNTPWILACGAIIGIFMMRLSAQAFLKIMDRYPVLEKTAYLLVGLAGLNVLLKIKDLNVGFAYVSIDHPLPQPLFVTLLLSILLGSLALNHFFPSAFAKEKK